MLTIVPELPPLNYKKRPLWFKLLRYASDYLLFALAQLINRSRSQNDKLKVLIIKTDALGDFILFTPALRAYRDLYPSAHIVLIVRKPTLPLAELCPYVNEVWEYNPARYKNNLQRRWYWFWRLSDGKFDIAIDAIYTFKDHLLLCLAGAPLRYGFDNRPGEKNYARRPFVNRLLTTDNNIVFEAERNNELLRFVGYQGEIACQTKVWTSTYDEISAYRILESFGVTDYAVVAPGAQDSWRKWGVEHFAKTIVSTENGMRLNWLVCGSEDETDLCENLTNMLTNFGVRAYNLAGKISLRQFSCIMSGALLCLANESMAAHLAAVHKISTVCVVGGGHFRRFYPYPGNPLTVAVNNPLPCYNCDWNCIQPNVECIEGVDEQDVTNALHQCYLQLSLLKRNA